MEEIKNPHDRFFKKLFSNRDVMHEFIEKSFPNDISKNINLKTLQLDETSYIDEILKNTYSDMVYNCSYKDKVSIKVTLLFEHKSFKVSYPHLQLLSYILRIWEKQISEKKKITPIIPIIFYHGKGEFKKKNIVKYFGKNLDENLKIFIPNFEYILIDTNLFSNEEIENLYDGLHLQMGMLLMKNIFTEKEIVENINKFFSNVKELFKTEVGKSFFNSIVSYLFHATKVESKVFSEKISEISKEAGKKFISTADKLILKGMKKGIRKGMSDGMKKGVEKGRTESIEKIAFNLINNGLDNHFIKKVTSLNIKEIKKLRNLQKLNV